MARSLSTGKTFARSYPGESVDKRAARLFLYKFAVNTPRCGHAITLAGTEPFAEVALMRDYLKWDASKTWFVDWAKDTQSRPAVLAALDGIQKSWPEANVRRADINKVVPLLPMIGFANLDFMGFMGRDSMQPCIRDVIARLATGGVLGVTWFRGREFDEPWRSAWDVHQAARDIEDLNERRWVGVLRMVEGWAKEHGVKLKLEGALEYQHRHSPMSVTVWRRT